MVTSKFTTMPSDAQIALSLLEERCVVEFGSSIHRQIAVALIEVRHAASVAEISDTYKAADASISDTYSIRAETAFEKE